MLLNRKARFNYNIIDTFEAGIVLLGSEVKVLRQGLGDISHSHVMVHDGEAWIVNMLIPIYKHSSTEYDTSRNRKLLLKKKQIRSLIGKVKAQGISIVPLKLYFRKSINKFKAESAKKDGASRGSIGLQGGMAKIEIGIAEGKKQFDKRKTIKERDLKREMARSIVHR